MSDGPAIVDEVGAALSPFGILPRGAVVFHDDEVAPVLAGGDRAKSILLLGNVGGSVWAPFSRWRARPENNDRRDPLDDWSKEIIRPVANSFSATAYFPSDPPWQPFQQWAMRAEGLKASPLGILIHPEFGLWHGYRGALGFSFAITPDGRSAAGMHPCDHCVARPCLSICPVGAVTASVFDVAACRSLLGAGEAQPCMAHGCLARNACPVGTRYRYTPAQLAFHMAALHL